MGNPLHERDVFVEFYSETVEMKAESEKMGRPIFAELPFIRIQVPGDRNNIVETKATEHHKNKYPRAWQRFQAMTANDGKIEGTPLDQWPQITKAQVREAQYFNVQTVESLAGISDASCQKMGMGWMELRRKAIAFLDAAAGTASTTAQAAENERLRQMIADLQTQMAEIGNAEKRGPGRPKKETADA